MIFKSNKRIKVEDITVPQVEELSESAVEQVPKKKKTILHAVFSVFHMVFSFIRNTFLLGLLFVLIGGVFVCAYVLDIVYDLPPIDPYSIKEGLTENSIIVDSQGELIETLYGDSGMRTNIDYEEIGVHLIDAIVAIEDKTFFDHKGFNYVRLAGAIVDAYQTGDSIKGTSTITQQLAKNVYLTNERAIERKVKEAYYAMFLERSLTKEQILEAYLNKISLGMQANGVASASRIYFSKEASELNLIESAIIAGIPKAPSRYAPMKRITKEQVREDHIIIDETNEVYTLVFNPVAQERYNQVIYQMYDNDMITEEEYEFAYDRDISGYIHPDVNKTNNITSYFGDLIKDDAAKALAEKEGITREAAEAMLYNNGYIIYSTIDFEMQEQLEEIYNFVDLSETFDDNMYLAIRKFQQLNDLSVDGVVGINTLDAIVEQTTATADEFSLERYSRLMTHEDIVVIKKALLELGLLTNEALFPNVVAMFNSDKNIVNDETLKVILHKYDNVINEENQLMIEKDAYYFDSQDNLVLLKNNFLDFYQQTDRVQVVVKRLFTYDENSDKPRYIDGKKFTSISGLYIYEGRDVLIDDAYKTKEDGNLIIDRSFFIDYPDFFIPSEDGGLLIDDRNYIVSKHGEIQPQSAFVVLDHASGQIKAIVGGRQSFGQNIYNRALVPHQPGSSIKPIGTYTVAIESRDWTAASVIDDVPTYLNKDTPGERWPVNWYEESTFKYRGRKNLRQGIEDSLNVVTAKLAYRLGAQNIIDHLKKLGITTIVEEKSQDVNISAVALGGMTYGISPLEMTAAYATYANQGVYVEPISFTKITDLSGRIIIDNVPERKTIMEEQVAFIIQDMMRTAVTVGYAKKAQIRENNEGIPIAGKTGTTSDKRDALFIGYSPYYTAAIWFGNDVRLKMDEGSGAAAEFWQVVMAKIHEDLPDKGFVEPEGLVRATVDRVSGKIPSSLSALDPAGSQIYTEIFLPGTVPTSYDDAHVQVTLCTDSNLKATEYCPNTEVAVRRVRLDPYDYSIAIADQAYMVPRACDIPEHQGVTVHANPQVIKTFEGGVVKFIRGYNLLLKDGNLKFIPVDSVVSTSNFNITFPSGEVVSGSSYQLEYITKPATQAAELLRRTEELEESEETEETEGNE
ncbi:MAG: transglycosylase domain-containing protein [Clostridiales bacterium]|nr:transglycosylase domain-containing protein [Clostridiales bacterium]